MQANARSSKQAAPKKRGAMFGGIGRYLDPNELKATANTPLPYTTTPAIAERPVEYIPPQPEPIKPPAVADYDRYEEVVREAMVLENHAFGANFQKLCMLFLLVFILIIVGITAIALAVGKHTSHGGTAFQVDIAAADNSAYMVTEAGAAHRAGITTYYYNLVLSNEVQQWQAYPADGSALPSLNSTLHTIVSYDVCCYADEPHAWLCSNGHVLVDMYTFEARLQDVSAVEGAVQCLVYLNSKHLTGSSCTLEVTVRT